MKCCCSHDATGMVLGCIYMILSAFGFLQFLFSFLQRELHKEAEVRKFFNTEDIEILCYFGGVSFVSYLFTVAIEKRQRYLILPWLFLSVYAFYISIEFVWQCRKYIFSSFGLIFYVIASIIALILAIEILVIVNGCWLFLKMRKEHLNEIERFEHQLNFNV